MALGTCPGAGGPLGFGELLHQAPREGSPLTGSANAERRDFSPLFSRETPRHSDFKRGARRSPGRTPCAPVPPPEHGVTFAHGGRGAAVPYCAERNARNDRRPRGLPEAAPTGVGRVAEPPRCLHVSAGVPGRGEDELGCVPTATPRAPLAPKRY